MASVIISQIDRALCLADYVLHTSPLRFVHSTAAARATAHNAHKQYTDSTSSDPAQRAATNVSSAEARHAAEHTLLASVEQPPAAQVTGSQFQVPPSVDAAQLRDAHDERRASGKSRGSESRVGSSPAGRNDGSMDVGTESITLSLSSHASLVETITTDNDRVTVPDAHAAEGSHSAAPEFGYGIAGLDFLSSRSYLVGGAAAAAAAVSTGTRTVGATFSAGGKPAMAPPSSAPTAAAAPLRTAHGTAHGNLRGGAAGGAAGATRQIVEMDADELEFDF